MAHQVFVARPAPGHRPNQRHRSPSRSAPDKGTLGEASRKAPPSPGTWDSSSSAACRASAVTAPPRGGPKKYVSRLAGHLFQFAVVGVAVQSRGDSAVFDPLTGRLPWRCGFGKCPGRTAGYTIGACL
jgi:hypothetical protein